jgi:hypothetical protein
MYCNDPACKEMVKKYNQLSSRQSSLQYAADDYDRQRSKGAFRAKFKDEAKLLDSLTEQKIKMVAQHARKSHSNPEGGEEAKADNPCPVY